MAKKRRWSRYQPPAEVRTEDGQRTPVSPRAPARPSPAPRVDASRSKPGSSRPTTRKPDKGRDKGKVKGKVKGKGAWWAAGLASAAIVVPLSIAAIEDQDDDDASGSDITTELIDEEFVGDSLAAALEEEGDRATLVRFDEYGLSVEYYDPNENQVRTVQTDSYTEGHTVRVEDNHYPDYRPRPFDLTLVEAPAVVRAVEDALERAEDPYSFSLRIEADRETGEVTMVTYVSGDDTINVVADLDGEFVEVD